MRQVAAAIREYANSLQERSRNALNRLAYIGADEVAYTHGYTYGGEISVGVDELQEGVNLHAVGKGVCFIEFGAGLGADPCHPYAGQMDFPIAYGSYSSSADGSGELVINGHWIFNNRPMTTVPARRGMFYASQQMLQEIPNVVREEFSGD